jgi:hypothetical protein
MSGFDPRSLFAAGQLGFWYDPSDLSTMFSDSAMTTPATVGGVVGAIRDKSGNAKHALQAGADSLKPTLQNSGGKYYLDFDGSNDFLVTSALDATSRNTLMLVAGVTKDSDAAAGAVCEFSVSTATQAGSFLLFAPVTVAANYGFNSRGSNLPSTLIVTTFTAPHTAVVACQAYIAGDSKNVRVNSVQAGSDALDQGTGAYGNHALYLGARGGSGSFLNGRIYSLIARFGAGVNGIATDAEILNTERYTAAKAGVSL